MQNASLSTDVQITVGSTDIGHTELPMDRQKNVLLKGSAIRVPLDAKGGCAMLFVWNKGRMLWKGIVPIGNEQPLIVDPDTPRVTYGLVNIPEHSGKVSREYFSAINVTKPTSMIMVAILVILAIIVLSFLVWYFMRNRK